MQIIVDSHEARVESPGDVVQGRNESGSGLSTLDSQLPSRPKRDRQKLIRRARLMFNKGRSKTNIRYALNVGSEWLDKILENAPDTVKPYLCPGCQKLVRLRPCQVCRAVGNQSDRYGISGRMD